MRRIVRRLGRTTPAELRFRAREARWTLEERVRYVFGGEQWKRTSLGTLLGPSLAPLDNARRAIAEREWTAAEAALRAHFTRRPQQFLISGANRERLAALVAAEQPSATGEAVVRAQRLAGGRHDLLGYRGVSFYGRAPGIDWLWDPIHDRRAPRRFWKDVAFLDPRGGDHKVIWELNRHQHWLALGRAAWLTGDPRWSCTFADELKSWLHANPPLEGINWASMLEIAFRSISWIWALHFFAPFDVPPEPWLIDLLVAIDRQLDHVARHLSIYFSPNTHLLGEALALYVAGRSLPELRSAGRWSSLGRDILLNESRRQVNPDGGHAEQSAHYHRYALDFYLLALAVARRTEDSATPIFEETVSRMAEFCRAIADASGRLPTIGDDDGGMLFPICGRTPADASDSLALASVLLGRPDLAVGDVPEEVLWMVGDSAATVKQRPAVSPPSVLFRDTGYAVLRSHDAHAIVDVGRHGFLNGGHAHADALSLVLSACGQAVLIDPGTSTYTMDAERRDRFRSTAMHNTAVVDRRAQSAPDGPFHWRSRADADVNLWYASPDFDYIEASHDGYQPLVHRRGVLRTPELWLIVDHLLGRGEHVVETFWHFSPEWTPAPGTACLTAGDSSWVAVASTLPQREEFRGDPEGLGWCAPVYGQHMPSLTIRLSSSAVAPFSAVTVVACSTAPPGLAVAAPLVFPECADGWHAAGVHATLGRSQFVGLVATPLGRLEKASDRRSRRVVVPGGELITDARVAFLQLTLTGEPQSLVAIAAHALIWKGARGFSVGPFAEAQDLQHDVTVLQRLSRIGESRQPG